MYSPLLPIPSTWLKATKKSRQPNPQSMEQDHEDD
jgi:hypothetical protein